MRGTLRNPKKRAEEGSGKKQGHKHDPGARAISLLKGKEPGDREKARTLTEGTAFRKFSEKVLRSMGKVVPQR